MSTEVTRRDFAKAAACASVATLAVGCSPSDSEIAQAQPGQAPATPPSTGREFPKGFFWGTATSAYQISRGASA